MATIVYSIESLPASVWEGITRDMDMQSLVSLIKASNKVLRIKLLQQGGIQTLNLDVSSRKAVPRLVVPRLTHFGGRFHPWTASISIREFRIQSLPPKESPLAQAITTFSATPYLSNCLSLPTVLMDSFPPNVTSIDYESNPYPWSAADPVPIISSLFANLQHLSLIFATQLPVKRHKELVAGLPKQLLSLNLSVGSLNTVFGDFGAPLFPPELTHLGLFLYEGCAQRHLDKQHMRLQLPSSIYSLHLPDYIFDVADQEENALFAWRSVRELFLYYVTVSSLPRLPSELRELRMLGKESSPTLSWPSDLASLEWAPQDRAMLCPLPNSLTKLSIIRTGKSYDAPIRVLFSKLCGLKSLRELRLGDCILPESFFLLPPQTSSDCDSHIEGAQGPALEYVEFPPSLIKIIVKDIMLQGWSLPNDTKCLDEVFSLVRAFERRIRPYCQLLTLQHRPFERSIDLQQLPAALETLRLPIASYPVRECASRPLVALHGFPHSRSAIRELPPTLTELQFNIPPIDPGAISVEELLAQCPQLKDIRGGILFCEALHLPPSLTDPAALLPSLSVSDAISSWVSTWYSTKGITVSARRVMAHEHLFNRLPAPLAVVSAAIQGRFCFTSDAFLEFLPGLTTLDLSAATLKRPEWCKTLLPRLPPTLTTFKAGPGQSRDLLWYSDASPVELPTSITSLTVKALVCRANRIAHFDLHPSLISLLRLEICFDARVEWIDEHSTENSIPWHWWGVPDYLGWVSRRNDLQEIIFSPGPPSAPLQGRSLNAFQSSSASEDNPACSLL